MSCHNHDHGHGHNHSHDDHVLPIPTNASQSLRNQVDFQGLRALNIEQPNDKVSEIFKPQENKFDVSKCITSDADEQIVLHIPFSNVSVKLYSVILRTSGGEKCPKTIKLFKNNDHIDFDNVEDVKPDFVLNHPQVGYERPANSEETVNVNEDQLIEHYLPRQKFTNVTSVTLFIQDLHGDEDVCEVYYVELRGEFKELNKDPIISIYEAAPNPADHKIAQRELNKSLSGT